MRQKSDAGFVEEREALEAVLSSEGFMRSPSQSQLLSYLCDKYFRGEANELKEYTIGTEAMGYSGDYSESDGSNIRVAMLRLRKRLKSYYDADGSNDATEIVLPVGQYIPKFQKRLRPELNLSESSGIVSGGEGSSGPLLWEIDCGSLEASAEVAQRESAAGTTGEDASIATGRHAGRGGSISARRMIAAAAVVAVTLAGVWTLRSWQRARRVARAAAALQGAASASAPVLANGSTVRILAGYQGSQYIDQNGNFWAGDRYFQGGAAHDSSELNPGGAAPVIGRVGDQQLTRHFRMGSIFSYDIPVPRGEYSLQLGFTEYFFGPGKPMGGGESDRLFSVWVNGTNVLPAIDIFDTVGGAEIRDLERFKGVRPQENGKVHLEFRSEGANMPLLNSIELVPEAPGIANPIRISAHARPFVDASGRLWNADDYFLGGRTVVNQAPLSGTQDDELYYAERYGNFSYEIPVPRGSTYQVTLYFAEKYQGSNPTDASRRRVFDVRCNGIPLLHNFEIVKEAGGPNRALVKVFQGLKPSSQGKLSLSFIPTLGYALVDAIEVVEEGH